MLWPRFGWSLSAVFLVILSVGTSSHLFAPLTFLCPTAGAYRLPVERRTRPVRPNTVSINVGLDCPPLGHPGKHDFEFQRIRPLTPQINWSVTNHIPAHPDQVDATGSFVLGTMHTEQKPEPSDVLYSLGCRGLLWHVLGYAKNSCLQSLRQLIRFFAFLICFCNPTLTDFSEVLTPTVTHKETPALVDRVTRVATSVPTATTKDPAPLLLPLPPTTSTTSATRAIQPVAPTHMPSTS